LEWNETLATILVLGSSGQVGAYLSKFLSSLGHAVIDFDLVNHEQEDLRIAGNPLLLQAVHEADFVFFLAFDVGGSHYLERYQDSLEFISNNVKIMSNTFDCISEFRKPFVFASSQMSNMHQSTYGLLKSVGEKYTHALGGKVVKFWNVYGIERDRQKFHVISDFIDMARSKGNITMRTSGVETRDFLYADDCCAGLLEIMINYEELNEDEIHLANNSWTSVLQVAEIIASHYKVDIIPGKSNDSIQGGVKNSPNQQFLKYWSPQISIQEGIRRIIQDLDSSS
jgi:nucleoside-diphosphate-sugar epimerase